MSLRKGAVRRVRLALAAAATLALTLSATLSACGGGSEPLSRAELVSRGDGICREAEARAAGIQRRPPRSQAEAAGQSRALARLLDQEVEDLNGLQAPDSHRDAMGRYLDARRRGAALVARGAEAAEANHPRGYLRLQRRFAASAAERRGLARPVGFRVCSARVPQGPP